MRLESLNKNPLLGQVWTPEDIAINMAKQCLLLNKNIVSILDPASGPGTFSNALVKANFSGIKLTCYDIDPVMANVTRDVNSDLNLVSETINKNYLLDYSLKNKFDLVIMNPPYIRQENIPLNDKVKYHEYLSGYFDVRIDKKTNIFALFLLKGIIDLTDDGILCAIVYDAITQTKYGKHIIEIMSEHAELISYEKIKMPFDNVLVDAAILFFKKRIEPCKKYNILNERKDGYVSIDELLLTRRGTGFPLRKAFIAEQKDPYFCQAKPFFIKQASLDGLVIKADNYSYILDEGEIQSSQLTAWLKNRAFRLGASIERFSIKGVKGQIAFNYYLRGRPRHLWNEENISVSDNFYVSTVIGDFPQEAAWLLLNSDLYLNEFISAARSQGNGLLKLQLFEYKKVAVPNWNSLTKQQITELCKTAKKAIDNRYDYETVKNIANKSTEDLFNV